MKSLNGGHKGAAAMPFTSVVVAEASARHRAQESVGVHIHDMLESQPLFGDDFEAFSACPKAGSSENEWTFTPVPSKSLPS